jgi:site-specific recombinase XerD
VCSLRLVPKENHRILESYQDFILSRQAALLTPSTIKFYKRTVGELVSFLSDRGIYEPEGITSGLVRGYFSSVSERGVASATVHAHARGTRAFLRFLYEEGYILTKTYKRKNA